MRVISQCVLSPHCFLCLIVWFGLAGSHVSQTTWNWIYSWGWLWPSELLPMNTEITSVPLWLFCTMLKIKIRARAHEVALYRLDNISTLSLCFNPLLLFPPPTSSIKHLLMNSYLSYYFQLSGVQHTWTMRLLSPGSTDMEVIICPLSSTKDRNSPL